MKNSDMKVIAIILSIALFFTIVTSNAVSIASVVFLAKGQTATEGTVDAGTATTPDAGTATTPNAGTATTPDATQPAGNSGSTADTTAPAGNSGSTATPDANKPAADSNTLSSEEALKMFQKAANDITTKGSAGYTKKAWQEIAAFQLGGSEALSSAVKGLIEGFMTKEADAKEEISEKNSEDAMNRFPASNCTMNTVQSVTAKASGSNYIITIVMKDQINPAKADTDGIRVMSKDILYMEDVEDTVKNDSTVSAIVKELKKAEINYKAYTITAEMTKDGKFVSISHTCSADLVADIKAQLVISFDVSGSGTLVFQTRYTNFKY